MNGLVEKYLECYAIDMEPPKKKLEIKHLLVPFVVPLVIGKTLILYFGIRYADFKDEGYGVGLACSLAFTAFILIHFMWKYRHHGD